MSDYLAEASVEMSFELFLGPLDGARVRRTADPIPQTIYVPRGHLGNSYVVWSSHPSHLFSCCYVLDGYRFVFRPRSKE